MPNMGGGLNEVGIPGVAPGQPCGCSAQPAIMDSRTLGTKKPHECGGAATIFRMPIPALDFASAGAD
jgi:hypothetical protein